MEDKDCFVKYIEIVPLDNFNNCSDVTDIKQEPDTVEVTKLFICLCNSWHQNADTCIVLLCFS